MTNAFQLVCAACQFHKTVEADWIEAHRDTYFFCQRCQKNRRPKAILWPQSWERTTWSEKPKETENAETS